MVASSSQKIPLFPLQVVLFPGMRLPLRIFEDRYKKLFDESLKGGAPFGIALVKEGPEVGGPATPYDVGTLAEIETVDYRDDSIFVLVHGTKRFRIRQLYHDRPYLVGRVEVLSEPPPPTSEQEGAALELQTLFEQYLDHMRSVARGLWGGELQVPETPKGRDARETAYAIVFALPMDHEGKQALLEEEDLTEFLARVRSLLNSELSFLRPEEDPSVG